jgi:N-acetylglucosaminyldiphosphoundecaprenol N-acetyl-beta-D-mannosaminyltransferase
LLGGKPGVAEDVANKLSHNCPGLIIAGTQHGYFKAEDTQNILNQIKEAHPHLLLVAFGSPLQEIWIARHAEQLEGIITVGVGGLFDFMAERVRRAPHPIRKAGMEWAWRLAMEPRRLWRRYLVGNVVFFGLVADAYFNQRKGFPANVQSIADYRNVANSSPLAPESLQSVEQIEYIVYEQGKAV